MNKINRTLLIINNNVNEKVMLQSILGNDYNLFVFDSCDEAFSFMLLHEPNEISLVIFDYSFYSQGNENFLKKIRDNKKYDDLPIIVTTDNSDKDLEVIALYSGATDFVTKPFNPLVLVRRVKNLIDLREKSTLINTFERDPLTNLLNKSTFISKIEEKLLSGPENEKFAIVSINIEKFRVINDLYGPKEGDKLLIEFAKNIQSFCQEYHGISCHINADDFAIFITISGLSLEDIKKKYPICSFFNHNLPITVKYYCGVYFITDRTVDISLMIDRAKLAGDSTKGNFNSYIGYYEESLRSKVLKEQELIALSEKALQNGEFQVYFQAKTNLFSGSCVGAEALVRWNSKIRGIISPGEFIPLFEKNGFISKLDPFVWEETIKTLSEWNKKGLPKLVMSMNVSRIDIYNPQVVSILTNLVKKYEVDPNDIELEITETAYTQNPTQLVNVVNSFRANGFKVAMDDFGAGYSSLNMLCNVPVDVLKLDLKFLNTDSAIKGSNILYFIVSLGKWMNLPIISEGIETIEQVNFLKSIGVVIGQGYYFSRPIPKDKFEEYLLGMTIEKIQMPKKSSLTLPIISDLWDQNSYFNLIFNSFVGALCILQEDNNSLFSAVRCNDTFFDLFNMCQSDFFAISKDLSNASNKKEYTALLKILKSCKMNNQDSAGDIIWIVPSTKRIFNLHVVCKMIYSDQDKALYIISFEDFTKQIALKKAVEKRNEDTRNDLRKQQEFLVDFFTTMSIGVANVSLRNFTISSINKAGAKIFGFDSIEEMKNKSKSLNDFILPEQQKDVHMKFLKASNLATGESADIDFEILDCKNKKHSLHSLMKKSRNISGEDFVLAILIDDTEKKRTQEKLIVAERQYEIIVKNSGQIVFTYDAFTHEAQLPKDTVNFIPLKLFKKLPEDLFNNHLVGNDSLAGVRKFFNDIESLKPLGATEALLRIDEDSFAWYDMKYYSQFDNDGKYINTLCLFMDIDNRKKLELSLIESSRKDSLTDLYNRKAFEVLVKQYMERNDDICAFYVFDIDNFKRINDTYGHNIGDEALVKISNILLSVFPENAFLGRLGGDEFVAFVCNIKTKENALKYGSKICETVANSRTISPQGITTISIGISLFPSDSNSYQNLYVKADTALYFSKQTGKNKCVCFEEENSNIINSLNLFNK